MKTYTRKQLSDELLCRAEDMIAELQTRALGEEPIFPNANPSLLNQFFELFSDIAKNTKDIGEIERIKAENGKDIIQAVCEGKLSLQEAKELMALVKENWEMESLPELIEKFAELST